MKRLMILALALCLLCGCGRPSGADTDAPGEETWSPVYTDWSKLAPYEPTEALYSYSDHYCGAQTLQSWDGYGTLLPYAGAYLKVENYITDRIELYGLVTARGEIVTAPVYANIYHSNGFLFLRRGSDALYQKEDPVQERGDFDLTVAASDGSWVREVKDWYLVTTSGQDGGVLALSNGAGDLELWNAESQVIATFSGDDFRPYFGHDFSWVNYEGGPWLELYDGLGYANTYFYRGEDGKYGYQEEELRLYLDLATGAVLETPPEGHPAEPEYGKWVEPPTFPGYWNVWSNADQVTGEVYYQCNREGGQDLLDGDGKVVWKDCDELFSIADGMLSIWTGRWEWGGSAKPTVFSWYELDSGKCVFRYPLAENVD